MDDEPTIVHSGLVPIKVVAELGGEALPERVFLKSFRIGRTPECDFQVADDCVSRTHVEVVFEAGHWWVKDLHSTNGTYLNGIRIERELLPVQAKLELGYGTLRKLPTFWLRISEKPLVPESLWRTVQTTDKFKAPTEAKAAPTASVTVRAFDSDGRCKEKQFRETFRMGRAPECGVSVDDPTVSKIHVELRVEDGHWCVYDLQSTNGTFLNEVKINRELLPSESKLQLGSEGAIFWLSTTNVPDREALENGTIIARSVPHEDKQSESQVQAPKPSPADDLQLQSPTSYQDTDAPTGLLLIRRPERWDESFGPNMTDKDVDRILMASPFKDMDPNAFPSRVPLRGILRHDTRILRYQPGDVIMRQGEFGNSAFFILSGSVKIILENLRESTIEQGIPKRKGIFESITQLWTNPRVPEFRGLSQHPNDAPRSKKDHRNSQSKIFLQDISGIVEKHVPTLLEEGEFFGEMSALNRIPRVATAICATRIELVEIRWQGLRELQNRCSELKEHIDTLYRERNLEHHFSNTPMFQYLTPGQLQQVAEATKFERYGNFDWYISFKTLADSDSSHRIENEPIIATEGDYPNGLILIRSGFARLSQRFGQGHRTHSFLQRGQTFGLEELLHNLHKTNYIPLQFSLRAIGYVDILLIPTHIVEEIILPTIPADLLPPRSSQYDTSISTDSWESKETGHSLESIDPDMLEFFVEQRFINGTATMLIDLDRCTRCDDCVRACAETHQNNPKFIRHGKQLGKYMVANACMHCADPVCMIGCPTGAIHRETYQGNVIINDDICIGCATCANSCPYHNIRMVESRDNKGNFFLDQDSHKPIMKATKCDLCSDLPAGPACQRACPHDALIRIGMQELEPLANWLKR